ncbi:phosphate propanoyltransferase [archaeon]|nr:phosphate propanoyltransferase [archaeon]
MENILVEVSNRHVHLSEEHMLKLFGNTALEKLKDLSQLGQFATTEKISLVNGGKVIDNVRVLAPPRKESQVEISKTDSRYLKMNVPLRESGDLVDSPGILIRGPKGEVMLDRGVIIAKRHLHVSDVEAEEYGLTDKQIIDLKIGGERGMTFHDVLVRVSSTYSMALHIDTDEGNALDHNGQTFAKLVSRNT